MTTQTRRLYDVDDTADVAADDEDDGRVMQFLLLFMMAIITFNPW